MSDEVARLVDELYRTRRSVWESARIQVRNWLEREREKALSGEEDKSRLRIDEGRIKNPDRAVRKLLRKLGDGEQVNSTTVIEESLTDLTGLKVLCKSTRDQLLICSHLQEACKANNSDIVIVEERDYVGSPKDSGYRAKHLLLRVPITNEEPVTVELQIKTLLQDAWSELTHENSYKPGSAVKQTTFHFELARVMAGLLEQVDHFADRLALDMEATLEGEPENSTAPVDVQHPDLEVEIWVTKVTGRYALAEDADGDSRLIPARTVRDLAGSDDYIEVSDYLSEGDRMLATKDEDERGRYFNPVGLPQS